MDITDIFDGQVCNNELRDIKMVADAMADNLPEVYSVWNGSPILFGDFVGLENTFAYEIFNAGQKRGYFQCPLPFFNIDDYGRIEPYETFYNLTDKGKSLAGLSQDVFDSEYDQRKPGPSAEELTNRQIKWNAIWIIVSCLFGYLLGKTF